MQQQADARQEPRGAWQGGAPLNAPDWRDWRAQGAVSAPNITMMINVQTPGPQQAQQPAQQQPAPQVIAVQPQMIAPQQQLAPIVVTPQLIAAAQEPPVLMTPQLIAPAQERPPQPAVEVRDQTSQTSSPWSICKEQGTQTEEQPAYPALASFSPAD